MQSAIANNSPNGALGNQLTPSEFIAKWQHNTLSERAGAQAHFLDLCEMLGVEKPGDADNYCFERGATRTGAGHGWADVWKRGHFGWAAYFLHDVQGCLAVNFGVNKPFETPDLLATQLGNLRFGNLRESGFLG